MSAPGRITRALRRLHVDVWNVGLVEAPIAAFLEPGFRPEVRWLPVRGSARLNADPFVLEHAGRWWVVYEALEHAVGRGFLAARALGPDGFGPEQVVLRRPFHLSYPFLLQEGGEIYCVPESFEAGEVALYRAREFPGGWERVAAILPGFPGIDSTFVRHAGRWWCFTTEKGNGHDRRLFLFHAEALQGPWLAHPRNPVKIDPRSARGAGTPFWHAGALYRPAQDCSRIHEERVTLNRIVELSTEDFREETVAVVEPLGRGPFPDKLHTLTAAGERTLIDGCRETLVFTDWRLMVFKLRRGWARVRGRGW